MLRSPINKTFLALFCLFTVIGSIIAGSADDKLELGNAEEVEVVIRQLYRTAVRHQLQTGSDVSTDADDNGNCECAKDSCGCCARLSLPKLKIDKNMCVNVTFLSQQIGVKLSITVNGNEVYSATVSIKQPPPMCFKLTKLASTCLYLYDLEYTNRSLSGCSRVEVKSFAMKIAELKLGCFSIPLVGDTESITSGAQVEWREISESETDNVLLQQLRL